MPKFFNLSEFPMPDTCNIWGEPIAPEDRIISLFTLTLFNSLFCQYSTSFAVLFSKLIFLTWALVIIFKFFLCLIGFRYPTEVLHLNPSFSVTWKYPQPWLSPVLKSFVLGIPNSSAAFWNSFNNGSWILWSDTDKGPPTPWNSLSPLSWFSAFIK